MTISPTQTQILTAAAQHEAQLAKAPERLPAGARNAVFRSMLKTGMLAEVPAPREHADHGWRQDEASVWIALRITCAGLAAIGLEPALTATDALVGAAAPELAHGDIKAAATPDSPPPILEAASAPQDAPAGRLGLRAAAAAVITAWEAAQPLDAPLTALREILSGQASPAPRAAGTPRKPREGTKQAAVLALLRRPEGATVAQVVEATGWASHTVRGFFAGLRTRHGIEVTVLERVRQAGSNKTGAKGSYSVYQITAVTA
jgi:hypothetical protein